MLLLFQCTFCSGKSVISLASQGLSEISSQQLASQTEKLTKREVIDLMRSMTSQSSDFEAVLRKLGIEQMVEENNGENAELAKSLAALRSRLWRLRKELKKYTVRQKIEGTTKSTSFDKTWTKRNERRPSRGWRCGSTSCPRHIFMRSEHSKSSKVWKKKVAKKSGFVAVIFNPLVQHYESAHLGIQYPCDQYDHISSQVSGLKLQKYKKLLQSNLMLVINASLKQWQNRSLKCIWTYFTGVWDTLVTNANLQVLQII